MVLVVCRRPCRQVLVLEMASVGIPAEVSFYENVKDLVE